MAEQSQAAAGSKPGVPLKYALGSLTFVILIVACVGCSFPGGFNSYIQANCLEVLGADAATFSATLMTILQAGYILASLCGGYLCDKLGAKAVTIGLFAITIVTLSLIHIWRAVTAEGQRIVARGPNLRVRPPCVSGGVARVV